MAIINFTRITFTNGHFIDVLEEAKEVLRQIEEGATELTEANAHRMAYISIKGLDEVLTVVESQFDPMLQARMQAAAQEPSGTVIPILR